RSVHSLVNQNAFDEAAFSIFLIGQLQAIAPAYPAQARDFCLIEAGLMTQLLETTAIAAQVGLCQIGGLNFERIRPFFALEESQILLHSLVGGRIDPQAAAIDEHGLERSSGALPQQDHCSDEELAERLRQFLRNRLPEYMLPSALVFLDALPLNANGKIDLCALPDPDERPAPASEADARPATDLENALSDIVKEVLKISQVDTNKRFFDLGGNSIHMIQVLNKLRQMMNSDLPATVIFQYPTVRSLAAFLSSDGGQEPSLKRSVDRARMRRASIEGWGRKEANGKRDL